MDLSVAQRIQGLLDKRMRGESRASVLVSVQLWQEAGIFTQEEADGFVALLDAQEAAQRPLDFLLIAQGILNGQIPADGYFVQEGGAPDA